MNHAWIVLLVVGWVVYRQLTEREVNISRLWLLPVLLFCFTASTLEKSHLTWLQALGMGAAFVVGSAFGWLRGKTTRFRVDPATGTVWSKGTVWGLLAWAVLIVFKLAARQLGVAAGHASVQTAANFLLFLSLGSISARRVYMYVKYRQLRQSSFRH